MAFMIAAYLIIWAAAFVFILLMMRKQTGIQREIASLQEQLSERKDAR